MKDVWKVSSPWVITAIGNKNMYLNTASADDAWTQLSLKGTDKNVASYLLTGKEYSMLKMLSKHPLHCNSSLDQCLCSYLVKQVECVVIVFPRIS